MIDTIVLTLNYPDFELTKPEKFDPDTRLVLAYKGRYIRAIYDPRQDVSVHEYVPRLTLINRIVIGGRNISLNVEFSVPALLYGNNFLEVTDSDFERVLTVLEGKLRLLGVEVTQECLATAKVSKIHYGKNFIFANFITPYSFIQEISQANISKQLDADKADYRNEGHSLKYQNNTFALMFYDKMKDLEKAKISHQKSVEQNSLPYGDLQHKLSKRSGSHPLEVLRMEVQFNKRTRIKTEMKKLGFEIEPTLQNLFSQRIAQKVCHSYLVEIRDAIILSKVETQHTPVQQFMELQKANPHTKPQVFLEYLGFMQLVESTDLRTARQLIAGDSSSKWQVTKNKYATLLTTRTPLQINKLIQAVEEFEPITTLDFEKVN